MAFGLFSLLLKSLNYGAGLSALIDCGLPPVTLIKCGQASVTDFEAEQPISDQILIGKLSSILHSWEVLDRAFHFR